MSELPERLLCRDRTVLDELEDGDPFYFRFVDEHKDGDEITIDAIRAPDFSVNCGQFSIPEDALLPDYNNQGVGEFFKRHLPDPMTTGAGTEQETIYTFVIQHDPLCNQNDPLRENYAHAEVRILKNDLYRRGSTINSKVKSSFRAHLAKNAVVRIRPQ